MLKPIWDAFSREKYAAKHFCERRFPNQAHPPKAFPLGGEGGPAKPGRMRGRPGTQRSRRKPAYRRQAVGHGLSTRKGWVQNRPLISLLRRQLPPKGKPLDVTGQPSLSRLYETPPPARPAGGRAVTGVGSKVVGKRRTHLSWFQKTREGGSREEETPPPWCSFLHFSQEKWRPPAGIPPGRCAPRPVKAPTTRRVRSNGGRAPGPTLQG